MPELPEAETIAADLRRRVVGRRIVGVDVAHADVLGPALTPGRLAERVRGRSVERVGRRGKNVVVGLDDGTILLVNLGMTGRLVASRAPRAAELRHVAVRFGLDDGDALLYDDARRFGRIEHLVPEAWRRRDDALGVEPFDDALTPARMHALTRRARTPIRSLLLDQGRIAGVGNIYANEALHRAGVRPRRRAAGLTRAETARLRDALREVLAEAIEARGTTLRDYRDGSGEAGGFEPRLRVYGREGEPCSRCGTTIKRVVLAGRSAFYCPRCQR